MSAPLLVLVVLIAAVGLYAVLRTSPATSTQDTPPPLPDRKDLEAPLAARIEERLAAVRLRRDDAAAWGKLGETYEVHEFYPQAITCYERAAELAPKEPRWPYWLGVALRVGDQKRALGYFQRAAELAPDWIGPHFYAGHGLLALGRTEEAAREFQAAEKLAPNDPAVLSGAAQAALAKNDADGALALLARVAGAKPRTTEWRWLSAAAWRAKGDEAKALEYARPEDPTPPREPFADPLREALLWNEGASLKLVRQRAEILLARGEGEKAVAELEGYLSLAPQSVEAITLLGDKLMQTGKLELAAQRYQIACTLDPTQARALSQWGLALARLGKREEAVAKLRQAIALDPNGKEAKVNLGSFLCGSKEKADREEGLRLLGEAVTAHPDELAIRVNFAQALRLNGRVEEGLATFARALELAPDDLRVRFEYGILCAEAGHLEEAERAFARVVAAEPTRMEARANWIRALRSLGREREALAELRKSLDLAPRDVGLRGELAWFLATSPDDGARSGAEALSIARELSTGAKDQNPELLLILAAAEAESGDLERAQVTVAAALELLKPKEGETISQASIVGIIDQALACRKAFAAGKPFRATP